MVKKHPKFHAKSGLSLIELMITVVVLTGGLVAILGSSVSMIRQQQYADYESLSAQYANLLLEELQDEAVVIDASDWDELADNAQSNLVNTDGADSNLFGGAPLMLELDGLGAIATVEFTAVSTDNPAEVQVDINVFPNGTADGAPQLTYTTSRFITW